jgi:transposase-like protein
MRHGRPPVGLGHVDRLQGSDDLKERLRVVLATITGDLSVEQACEHLGVGPSRLHEMRRQALEGALAGLMPARTGRPSAATDAKTDRERALEQKVQDLEVDLQAALVRTELALAMPHLFDRAAKKKARRWKAKTNR